MKPYKNAFWSAFLLTMGGILLLGPTMYTIFVVPEWTASQTLRTFWSVYTSGVLLAAAGVWLDPR